MTGATKKRAQENRQAATGHANPQDIHGQRHLGRYDGPSDRPGSSSGPPRPGSSRGDAPHPGAPSNAPGASVRSASRQRSAAGPPSSSGAPLRDPARDPPVIAKKTLPSRVDWGGNLYAYYSNEPVSEYCEIQSPA